MTGERFMQIGVCFIDTTNTDISYCCANDIDCKNIIGLLNALHEENERLKNQREVYDKFLDLNDLEIDWQFLCIADECNEEQDKDCRDCEYLGELE